MRHSVTMVRFAVFYTGASTNTARAFGPAVVTGFSFPGHSNHWVVCLVFFCQIPCSHFAYLRSALSTGLDRFWALCLGRPSIHCSNRQSRFRYFTVIIITLMPRSINYLELNPAQASTKVEDSPPTPTIFAPERETRDTEASGSTAPSLARKIDAE